MLHADYRILKQKWIFNHITFFPTAVDPVKDTRGILLSCAMAFPISAPPQHNVDTAVGKLFFSKTDATIFVTATDTKGVVGAPFHNMVSPQTCNKSSFYEKNIKNWLKFFYL